MAMQPQTLVIKIGTSSLARPETGQLALSTIAALVETLCKLINQGHRVVLVSSGAVGVGCSRLGLTERPKKMAFKQAIAAVGQGRLMRTYDDFFSSLQQPIAQILLTRRELIERTAYVNVYNTFQALFELGVIAIVNENDTVAIDELKFGDNDTLSALVASLVEADWLFLLTDVDRLYSSDPRLDPQAYPIALVKATELAQLQVRTDSTGSAWGTGGMATKITAARIATGSGVRTVITHGQKPEQILAILQGADLGTQFEAQPRSDNARKRWIAYGLVPTGKIVIDAGAVQALKNRGKSLLAIGVIAMEGEFSATDAVVICDPQGQELGRGLVNYNCNELEKIKGLHSEAIATVLGYVGPDTVVHRDNLVLQEN
ncbi:glutamate 5-kinase [Synechocystis sp. PCC 7339]|uniref:glutamate 5-kinase n=1 Tax=unclassified Synechocystis TaxID=2640012 RepID=UPI001BAE5946|nr:MULTISPECIES: glutamate 5-kinase [unclassified Synechocystis]QUS60178.1 glutamate 5-kinase [Synechocystis sp. PCC 7338]UAJ72376.1 glutamate 5-kinase [Synechocystis sp. PCC 7339]